MALDATAPRTRHLRTGTGGYNNRLYSEQSARDKGFGYLHRVEGGSLAEVV